MLAWLRGNRERPGTTIVGSGPAATTTRSPVGNGGEGDVGVGGGDGAGEPAYDGGE